MLDGPEIFMGKPDGKFYFFYSSNQRQNGIHVVKLFKSTCMSLCGLLRSVVDQLFIMKDNRS